MVKSSKKRTGQVIRYEHNIVSLDLQQSRYIDERACPVVIDNTIYYLRINPNTSYSNFFHSTINAVGQTFSYELNSDYRNCAAVGYQGSIFLIGGSTPSACIKIEINGSPSANMPSLPQKYSRATAVVADNKIHLFGGDTNDKSHYTWDGVSNSWTLISTETPVSFPKNYDIAYARVDGNGRIHILRGYSHYELVNGSWVQKDDLSIPSSRSSIFKGTELHIFSQFTHYNYNGSTISEYDMPYNCSFMNSYSVLVNNSIASITANAVYYLES